MKRLFVSSANTHKRVTQKQIEELKTAYYENHTDICELEGSDYGFGNVEDLAYFNGYDCAMRFVFKTLGIEI